MGKFRTSHPEFYETYFALREIIVSSTTTTQLKDIITDAADATQLKDAVITVVELSKSTKSNTAGEYSFKPVAFGKFTVTVTKEGFDNFQADEVEVKLGDITHLDVELEK